MNTILHGHDTPEAAHVHNHPFGSKRCWQRIWVETRPSHGQRTCRQTTKKFVGVESGQEFDGNMPEDHAWNKPKKGTYSAMVVLYQDNDDGHIHTTGLSPYAGPIAFHEFDGFVDACENGLSDEQIATRVKLEAMSRRMNPDSWGIYDHGQAA